MTQVAKNYLKKIVGDIPQREKVRPKAKVLSDEEFEKLIGIANGTISFTEVRPNPAERCLK